MADIKKGSMLSVSLNADGTISMTATKEQFAEIINNSFAKIGEETMWCIGFDCTGNSGSTLDPKDLQRLVTQGALNEKVLGVAGKRIIQAIRG